MPYDGTCMYLSLRLKPKGGKYEVRVRVTGAYAHLAPGIPLYTILPLSKTIFLHCGNIYCPNTFFFYVLMGSFCAQRESYVYFNT